ncbi:HNH endonuclease [Lacticaseibacillus hulanensis]|uniref:HNH endonuclease n=1 Tax=Lacticaseibacillus hulanensis TaxID=2493111 RepID=UPI0013E3FEC3|nr:HNH endonuclease signature motif containing protein [Lacticaseibacillus hulanensis]
MNEKELQKADLVPNVVYQNDKKSPNTLSALLKTRDAYCSSPVQGGFRMLRVEGNSKRHAFLALVVSQDVRKPASWNDTINGGILTYDGDNDTPNTDVKFTKGNKYLDKIFADDRLESVDVYPIMFFKSTSKREIEFVGLCFPLVNGLEKSEKDGVHNFRANFYIDQKTVVTKAWLTDLKEGRWKSSPHAPQSWTDYICDEMPEIWDADHAMVEPRTVLTRTTQIVFRRGLLQTQKSCLICQITDERLLIASHIKRWVDSKDREKVDPHNGLILCALHDRLFDRLLITFSSTGDLIVSKSLSRTTVEQAGLIAGKHYPGLEPFQHYLRIHRKRFDTNERL